MKIPRLPAPVGSVVAPNHFAPSRFEELRQCPLRVFADPDKLPGTLARGPSAFFGLLLHHVRHEMLAGRWGGEVYAERALDRLMQRRARADGSDARIRSSDTTPSAVDAHDWPR